MHHGDSGPREPSVASRRVRAPVRPGHGTIGAVSGTDSGAAVAADVVLARAAGLGDQGAFAELVRRHAPAMTRYARRMLGNEPDAQDAVQEALLSAWRGMGDFRGEAAVRTWLFRLVAAKAVSSRRRRRPDPVDTSAVERADPAAGPAQQVRAGRLLADLQRALDGLPPGQRSVWLLREIERLGYAEIGEVLGMPTSTVRGQLARARAGVAARMAPWR